MSASALSALDLIVCHLTADFDTLGSALGAAHLYPGARILLAGGCHPQVQHFLGLHRNGLPLIARKAVNPAQVRRLVLVDCADPGRLGSVAGWLDRSDLEIHIYDHHCGGDSDPRLRFPHPAAVTLVCLEPVGSTSTLMVERLRDQKRDQGLSGSTPLSASDLTALALGIHADTGSLTFGSTTVRDGQALVWLMEQGLNLDQMAPYLEGGLSKPLQDLLSQGLVDLHVETIRGYGLGSWLIKLDGYQPGLSSLAMHLLDLADVDILILGALQQAGSHSGLSLPRLSLIGRSRHDFAALDQILGAYGGGGHPRAAAVTLKRLDPHSAQPERILAEILETIAQRIPKPVTARDLMSSPVRTIRPDLSVREAQGVLLRYGHSGVVVVNDQAQVVGVISRRDIDLALHHGFGHAPVKGYMTSPVETVTPQTPIHQIQSLMISRDMGRLPVLSRDPDGSERLLGIVTRTDVLRHLHDLPQPDPAPQPKALLERLQGLGQLPAQEILQTAATLADQMELRLYLVGGGVRDLLLGRLEGEMDLDLVVDGSYPLDAQSLGSAPEGWGVRLGRALHQHYPETKLEIHGRYQTVALIWPGGRWIDIATARTEFYPLPAANPEVDLGSIQQDLYRRDFTINALALRLNGPEAGQILDAFGGRQDLELRRIRVLHANSFLEDPTRIFRAVRFAARLDFRVAEQTESYIRSAVATGLVDAVGGDRLKQELKLILDSSLWRRAMRQLGSWQALRCLHPELHWDPQLEQQVWRAGAWYRHFERLYPQLDQHHRWQIRLERMLGALPQADQVAAQLNLTQAGIERLRDLAPLQAQILPQLQPPLRPSQVMEWLDPVEIPMLILLAAVADPGSRRIVYRYLREWHHIKPLLNGHDLRAMGYPPGPHFQEMLTAIKKATLDGSLTTVEEAKDWVIHHFEQ